MAQIKKAHRLLIFLLSFIFTGFFSWLGKPQKVLANDTLKGPSLWKNLNLDQASDLETYSRWTRPEGTLIAARLIGEDGPSEPNEARETPSVTATTPGALCHPEEGYYEFTVSPAELYQFGSSAAILEVSGCQTAPMSVQLIIDRRHLLLGGALDFQARSEQKVSFENIHGFYLKENSSPLQTVVRFGGQASTGYEPFMIPRIEISYDKSTNPPKLKIQFPPDLELDKGRDLVVEILSSKDPSSGPVLLQQSPKMNIQNNSLETPKGNFPTWFR